MAQIAMGIALLGGAWLAHRRQYRAHAYCQSAVLLLNVPLISFIMVPSFQKQVEPQLPGTLGQQFYAIATVHAAIGAVAQVLGLYILLVAGTGLVPRRFLFRQYKRWMRTELVLWWIVIVAGIGLYSVWYSAPAASESAASHRGNGARARLVNVEFRPKTLTVPAGTTVVWVNAQGVHTVDSDQGLFRSSSLATGRAFRFTFNRPGTFPYHCDLHGAAGGVGMAGRIIVKPRVAR